MPLRALPIALALLPLAANAATCEGGLAPFGGTGLCPAEVLALIPPARLPQIQAEPIEGCSYAVQETQTPDPDEAIVFLALSCNGKTTTLEFGAGAHSAALSYGTSGFFDSVPTAGEEGAEVVRLFLLGGAEDPKAMLLGMARETTENPGEAAACELRAAGDGFPADAYLIDVNDAYKQANALGSYDGQSDSPDAGVYAACGPWGITDARDFWLMRDGYAWFVTQGQDVADFDAGTLTILRKGANGQWAAAQ